MQRELIHLSANYSPRKGKIDTEGRGRSGRSGRGRERKGGLGRTRRRRRRNEIVQESRENPKRQTEAGRSEIPVERKRGRNGLREVKRDERL